jgi:hypothetical protein
LRPKKSNKKIQKKGGLHSTRFDEDDEALWTWTFCVVRNILDIKLMEIKSMIVIDGQRREKKLGRPLAKATEKTN